MDNLFSILHKLKKEIKESKLIIFFFLIYSVFVFIMLYIRVTINSYYDIGVLEFIAPFNIVLNITYILWLITIILGIIPNKKVLRFVRTLAISNIIVALIITCFSILPCMYNNPDIITLKEKLFRSFFCVSFSITSWLNIFIVLGISYLIIVSSLFGQWILKKQIQRNANTTNISCGVC